MIPRDSLRARIERRLAIDQKPVMVVSMVQGKLKQPGAVGLAFHGIGFRAPIIEVAHQMDLFGLGRETNEIGRLGHFLRGISVVGKQRMGVMHVLGTLILLLHYRINRRLRKSIAEQTTTATWRQEPTGKILDRSKETAMGKAPGFLISWRPPTTFPA